MPSQHTHKTSTFSFKKFPITLVCDGVQSPSNIGSLFRICDALGVSEIIFCNAVINFNSPRLQKTARNTHKTVSYSTSTTILETLESLKNNGFTLVALEITDASIPLETISLPKNKKIALVIGNEKLGVSKEVLKYIPASVHIPMFGKNSSMNVVQATAIALQSIINKLYIY